jgi:hypothetical protein
MSKAVAIGTLLLLGVGGAVLIAHKPKPPRTVEKWRKNPDGTCTYTYDDGTEEVAVCSDAPA